MSDSCTVTKQDTTAISLHGQTAGDTETQIRILRDAIQLIGQQARRL
jgi:hypothetical protein